MACSSNAISVDARAATIGAGQGARSVDRFGANAGCPLASRVSYQPRIKATSGRLWPALSVPRAWLLVAGAARNVTALAAAEVGTMQSSANANPDGKQSTTSNAR